MGDIKKESVQFGAVFIHTFESDNLSTHLTRSID
jgi:hypothetical protein